MHGQLILWTDWLRIQKHIKTITFSSKPNRLHYATVVKNAEISFHLHHKCQTTCLWYGWVNVRRNEFQLIACNCMSSLLVNKVLILSFSSPTYPFQIVVPVKNTGNGWLATQGTALTIVNVSLCTAHNSRLVYDVVGMFIYLMQVKFCSANTIQLMLL